MRYSLRGFLYYANASSGKRREWSRKGKSLSVALVSIFLTHCSLRVEHSDDEEPAPKKTRKRAPSPDPSEEENVLSASEKEATSDEEEVELPARVQVDRAARKVWNMDEFGCEQFIHLSFACLTDSQ